MLTRAAVLLILTLAPAFLNRQAPSTAHKDAIFGFRDPSAERAREREFLAVPDPQQAKRHLQELTRAPHIAGSPEDKATAEYVAARFREAGLDTQIVEYRVPLNYPAEIKVDIDVPGGKAFTAPSPEHVSDDPYQNDSRIVPAYSGYSPSGDVEGEAVYANYGRPEDFDQLKRLNIDVRGKIVVVRYGQNFRGVKSLVAQERGAAGVIIYSDPFDDGYYRGDPYPKGPWRPESSVQRGSIGYMFEFPGDPTTPGIASVPNLPEAKRQPMAQSPEMPKVPTTPLSWGDARHILEALGGPAVPRGWQGALPFTYHVGPGPVRVKLHLKQNYAMRTIWDVIGSVRGGAWPDQWVVAGNHRDAWVYGAVDPNSGTAAMLETVHGIGELLKSGWRPKRTIVFGSWDAEEFGLIGSTEWAEQHADELERAAAYFNMDVAVAGPNFTASAVPSLKRFVREITRAVPSPQGQTVYDAWSAHRDEERPSTLNPQVPESRSGQSQPTMGDLGSGSDFTPFLQHLGVPASDIGSSGSYGVYHSAFDNFAWFSKFADPDFVYEQEMARVFGLEVMRMASADVLPYDYGAYGQEIEGYLKTAQRQAQDTWGEKTPSFAAAEQAAARLARAGAAVASQPADPAGLNRALIAAERGFLAPGGLPGRAWYRHVIYAPGKYTGYAAAVLPGINEAIAAKDAAEAAKQIEVLTQCLERVSQILENAK